MSPRGSRANSVTGSARIACVIRVIAIDDCDLPQGGGSFPIRRSASPSRSLRHVPRVERLFAGLLPQTGPAPHSRNGKSKIEGNHKCRRWRWRHDGGQGPRCRVEARRLRRWWWSRYFLLALVALDPVTPSRGGGAPSCGRSQTLLYNHHRPHGALAGKTPAQYLAARSATTPHPSQMC